MLLWLDFHLLAEVTRDCEAAPSLRLKGGPRRRPRGGPRQVHEQDLPPQTDQPQEPRRRGQPPGDQPQPQQGGRGLQRGERVNKHCHSDEQEAEARPQPSRPRPRHHHPEQGQRQRGRARGWRGRRDQGVHPRRRHQDAQQQQRVEQVDRESVIYTAQYCDIRKSHLI